MRSTLSPLPFLLLSRRFRSFPWLSSHIARFSSSAAAAAAALSPSDPENCISLGSSPACSFDRGSINPKLDSISHPYAVAGVFGRAQLPGAMNIFKAACLEGRCPSISVCNTLLGALVDGGGDLQSVVFVYKEMVKGGVFPDVQTLNFLIDALFQASLVDSAMAQFRRMKAKGCAPNSRTFELVMRNLCINDRVDESVMVLDEMFECGCKPDGDFFSSIIPMFCTFDRFPAAMKLFELMKAVDVLPDSPVYTALICCLCERGDLGSAINLIEEMSERDLAPETDAYVSVVNGLCKMGKLDAANNFLVEKCILSIEPYNALLQVYCREGRYLHANYLLTKMSENGVSDQSSWNILIRALCESPNVRKAFEVLARMVVLGYRADDVTFSAVTSGYCHLGTYNTALEIFKHICTKSWTLDTEACTDLIHGLCQVGMVEKATEIFYYLSDKGHVLTTSSINMLISHICSNGSINEAIKLRSVSFCKGLPSSTSAAFNKIILALLELKTAKHARVILSQMIVGHCPPDDSTYCLLIHGFCDAKMTDDAVLLFDQMIHLGVIPSDQLVDGLLSHLAKYSQVHKIARDLENLIDQGLSLSCMIYNRIICQLLREDYHPEACKFLDKMLEKGWVPDAEAHGLLIGNVGRGEYSSWKTTTIPINDTVTSILTEGLSQSNDCMTET